MFNKIMKTKMKPKFISKTDKLKLKCAWKLFKTYD